MITPDLQPLADQLGIAVAPLSRLGITRNGPRWLIPERDAEGRIIGYATRDDAGRKSFTTGGKRGLTVAWPIDAYAGTSANEPVLVVEGMSDTAAGLMIGSIIMVTQRSGSATVLTPANPSSATPITVKSCPLRARVWPIIAVSPSSVRCQ